MPRYNKCRYPKMFATVTKHKLRKFVSNMRQCVIHFSFDNKNARCHTSVIQPSRRFSPSVPMDWSQWHDTSRTIKIKFVRRHIYLFHNRAESSAAPFHCLYTLAQQRFKQVRTQLSRNCCKMKNAISISNCRFRFFFFVKKKNKTINV